MSLALRAQWLDYPTPGIPRLPDGKPNLSAPAPRTADGKPDLSGLWEPTGEASSSFCQPLGAIKMHLSSLSEENDSDSGPAGDFVRAQH